MGQRCSTRRATHWVRRVLVGCASLPHPTYGILESLVAPCRIVKIENFGCGPAALMGLTSPTQARFRVPFRAPHIPREFPTLRVGLVFGGDAAAPGEVSCVGRLTGDRGPLLAARTEVPTQPRAAVPPFATWPSSFRNRVLTTDGNGLM